MKAPGLVSSGPATGGESSVFPMMEVALEALTDRGDAAPLWHSTLSLSGCRRGVRSEQDELPGACGAAIVWVFIVIRRRYPAGTL